MKKQKRDFIASDVLAKYLQDIDEIPMLSPTEEAILADKIKKGDRRALARLVNANLKFVVFIARDYQERGLPLEELICEGNIGLMEAANRYDHRRGVKFISYAVWWIRQAILRALANHSRLVRLPINHVWALQKMVSTVENLQQNLGRVPELEEVAHELKISPKKLSKNMTYWGRECSLDDSTRPSYENLTLIDKISSDEFAAPYSSLINESLRDDIRMTLETLTECEAKVIKLYYGIEEDRPLTLLEIGDIMNLSRERIRQIKNKALRKLRYLNRREKLQQYLG